MTTLADLSASDLRRAAELKDEIEKLTAQISALLGEGYTGRASASPRISEAGRKRVATQRGRKTVADCVLEAIGGETMPVAKIIIRASQIRGKEISRALLAFTLAQLKKAKRITNPARGQYRRV